MVDSYGTRIGLRRGGAFGGDGLIFGGTWGRFSYHSACGAALFFAGIDDDRLADGCPCDGDLLFSLRPSHNEKGRLARFDVRDRTQFFPCTQIGDPPDGGGLSRRGVQPLPTDDDRVRDGQDGAGGEKKLFFVRVGANKAGNAGKTARKAQGRDVAEAFSGAG